MTKYVESRLVRLVNDDGSAILDAEGKPIKQPVELLSDVVTDSNGDPVLNTVVSNGGNFTPSSAGSARLTMNGTAQGGAIGSGVTKLQIYNKGAATEDIYVAFGATQTEADDNLTFTTDLAPEKATTGHPIPAVADAGANALQVLNVPSAAIGGFYSVGNAEDSDVQIVIIAQGY